MRATALLLCASAAPGGASAAEAARAAALEPGTWLPLAGAAAFALAGDADHELADWARRETPLFGSNADAAEASSDIRKVLQLQVLALEGWHAFGPAADAPAAERWGPPAAALTGILVTGELVDGIKELADRERPDGSDRLSFPSANEVLARDHGDAAWSGAWRAGNVALASLGAWSRLEAGAHHPTDVLVGAALGNFLSAFLHGLIPDGPTVEAGADHLAVVLHFG